MFLVIRLIISIIVFAVCFLFIKKSTFKEKKSWYIGAIVTVVLVMSVLSFIPIENMFVTFSSPEAVYTYYYKDSPDLVINGTQCDFLVKQENASTTRISAIPKTENGWKLSLGANATIVATTRINDMWIIVYRYKQTSDYLICVTSTKNGSFEISDNRNSTFLCLSDKADSADIVQCSYYAYIGGYDNNYRLLLDGQEFAISDAFA